MSFKHLNISDRENIFLWSNQGVSIREIARRLKYDHKTVSYELKINTKFGKKYSPSEAQKRADRVGNNQRYKAPLKSPEIFLYVREHLRPPFFWTPEMISGRIPLDIENASIAPETIYQYIYRRKNIKYKLWENLPCSRKKRMKKLGRKVFKSSKIPDAISIDVRPKYINNRSQIGHWETDNVEGPKTTRPALSVSVERKLRYVEISKIQNKTSGQKVKSLTQHLASYPKHLRISITQDNGSENSNHALVKHLLGTEMYFCHPYHSWEKGSVENRNKVIRRFFPKGTDFSKISNKKIRFVQDVINNMPMKLLKFKKPSEKMNEVLNKIKRVQTLSGEIPD